MLIFRLENWKMGRKWMDFSSLITNEQNIIRVQYPGIRVLWVGYLGKAIMMHLILFIYLERNMHNSRYPYY